MTTPLLASCSHLIARIQVGSQTALRQSAPPPPEPTPGTGDLMAQPGPGPTTLEVPAPTPAPPPPPVAEVVTPAPNPTPDTTPPPPVEQPLPQPDPIVDTGLQAAAVAGLKPPVSADVAAAPAGRRLLGARAAATVASAAGAAGVAAMAAGSEQAGGFEPSMAPAWSTALNRVLSKEDVAAAMELIRQVGWVALGNQQGIDGLTCMQHGLRSGLHEASSCMKHCPQPTPSHMASATWQELAADCVCCASS